MKRVVFLVFSLTVFITVSALTSVSAQAQAYLPMLIQEQSQNTIRRIAPRTVQSQLQAGHLSSLPEPILSFSMPCKW